MLMPKRAKYRKVQRGRMTGTATRGNTVAYGEYGIQALEPGWITGNQIEAARIAMTRYTKRGGKVWIKIFPDKPYSKKGLGTRMGSGKARHKRACRENDTFLHGILCSFPREMRQISAYSL